MSMFPVVWRFHEFLPPFRWFHDLMQGRFLYGPVFYYDIMYTFFYPSESLSDALGILLLVHT